MAEPTPPDTKLTPQAERVWQNSVLGFREIRHPLTSLVGYSELLLTGGNEIGFLTEKQRDFLTIINRCGKDELEVTHLLLGIHQLIFDPPQLQFEQVDLGHLMQQFLSTWQTSGEIKMPDNLPHIWLDRRRFQQALKWIFWRAINRNDLDAQDVFTFTGNFDENWVTFHLMSVGTNPFYFENDDPTLFFSRSIIEMHGGQLTVDVQQAQKRLEISFTLPIERV